MDSEDSEAIFNKYIVYDNETDETDKVHQTNKENQKPSARQQPNTKKEQFDRIAAFHNENERQLKNKESLDQLWDGLTDELNAMGPPVYSSANWRKKWTEHKYNKKRKRSLETVETPKIGLRLDEASSSSLGSSPKNSQVQLGEISAKQDLIVHELQKANTFLEEITQRLDKMIGLLEILIKK